MTPNVAASVLFGKANQKLSFCTWGAFITKLGNVMTLPQFGKLLTLAKKLQQN